MGVRTQIRNILGLTIQVHFFIGNRFSQNRPVRLPNFLAKFGPKVAYLKLTVAYLLGLEVTNVFM